MRRRSGRWLVLAVLAALALAPFAQACGTLLGIDPDTPPGPDGGPGEGSANSPEAAVVGDAAATDGAPEACVDADCGVPTCAGTARSCPLPDGGTTCVDDKNDDQNCGACGHICNIAGSCVTGGCARRVFVTSASYPIGGSNHPRNLSEADAFCQSAATGRGLRNTFRAWMSDSAEFPANGTRFTPSTQPYKLMNGTTVAASFAGLTSGFLLAPIDHDENGASLPAGMAWTGTRADGHIAPGGSCTSWSDDAVSSIAKVGDVTATAMTWTETTLVCAGSAHLYCFEQ